MFLNVCWHIPPLLYCLYVNTLGVLWWSASTPGFILSRYRGGGSSFHIRIVFVWRHAQPAPRLLATQVGTRSPTASGSSTRQSEVVLWEEELSPVRERKQRLPRIQRFPTRLLRIICNRRRLPNSVGTHFRRFVIVVRTPLNAVGKQGDRR